MKRAATATILAGSLLLAGCDKLPANLEDFIDWRQKFFLHLDPSVIDNLLGPILGILVALAVCLSLFGLTSNLGKDRPIFSGTFATGIAIFGAIAMVFLYIPIATALGEALLPPDLTVDKVFSALHWDLTASLSEIVTVGWGVTFTLLLPLVSAMWQIVMLIAAVVAVFISIGGRTLKGVFFALFQIVGWALFLVLFNTLVTLLGEYYPSWDFAPVEAFVTAFYTGAAILLMLACYVGVPWLAASLSPSGNETETVREEKRSKMDWGKILTIPIPIPQDGDDETGEAERPADADYGEQPTGGEPIRPLLPPSGDDEGRNDRRGSPSPAGSSPNQDEDILEGNFHPASSEGVEDTQPPDEDRLFDVVEKHETRSRKTLKTVDKVAKVAETVGVVTGKPEVIIGAKAVEFTTRVIKDATEKNANAGEVVKGHLKGLVERAVRSKYSVPEDEDLLFPPDEEGGSE